MTDDLIETLYAGRFVRLARRGTWEFAERTNPQGAVVIVAVTPQDRVLMVEQYRIPIQSRTLEFPAGLVGDQQDFADESWRESAQRELLEETGWAAERIDSIMSGPSSAGLTTEMMHFVRASGLRQINADGGDPSENIVVHEVPRREIAQFVAAKMVEGYAIDPKVYAGIYFLFQNADGSPAGQ